MTKDYPEKIISFRDWKKERLEKRIIDFFENSLSEKSEIDYYGLKKEYSDLIQSICNDYGIDYENPDLKKLEKALFIEESYCDLFVK